MKYVMEVAAWFTALLVLLFFAVTAVQVIIIAAAWMAHSLQWLMP